MEAKKERSYTKESLKTTPTGIRFDIEQLEFIQKKEPKLITKQRVVDFLLNKYWWEFKMAKPSHKGLPLVSEIKFSPTTPKSYDGKKNPNPIHDEPLTFKPYKTAAQYLELKRDCETADQWSILWEEINNSENLTFKEKQTLKTAL